MSDTKVQFDELADFQKFTSNTLHVVKIN